MVFPGDAKLRTKDAHEIEGDRIEQNKELMSGDILSLMLPSTL